MPVIGKGVLREFKPWEVGEHVVIDSNHHGLRRGKIARILAKHMELEDGSKWDTGSFPSTFPRSKDRFYTGPHLRRPIAADREVFIRQSLGRTLTPTFIKDCSLEELVKINDVVKAILAARPKKEE